MSFSRAFVLILRGFFVLLFNHGGQYNIFFVCVTRGVLAGEVVGVLDRMATSALLPNVV